MPFIVKFVAEKNVKYKEEKVRIFFIPFYFRGLDEEERNDLKGIISIILYREEKDKI